MAELKAGMTIKNWNQLCDLMEWKRTKGGQNSRIAQEKDLNTICKWHKKGHKIIIDEVYYEPKKRENNRFNKDLKDLKEAIERQIIREVAKEYKLKKDEKVFNCSLNLTINQWLERLGLINPNYRKAITNTNIMAYILDVNKNLLNDVIAHSKSTTPDWLRSAFNNLKSKRIALEVRDSYMLVVSDENGNSTGVDAEYLHCKVIRESEGRVLDRYGIKSVGSIFNGSSKDKITAARFYFEVRQEIRDIAENNVEWLGYDVAYDLMNMKSYYSTIHVDFTPFRIENKEREAEKFLEYDKEVMEEFLSSDLGELTREEFVNSFVDAIQLLDDVKEYISTKVSNRLIKNTCKRIGDNNLPYTVDDVIDVTNKLHSLTTTLITDEEFNEFVGVWGEACPNFDEECF